METITCSCGAKVARPIGSSSLCGTCGKEVVTTKPSAQHPAEEAAQKDLGMAQVQSLDPRPLIPLKDEPPAAKQ